MKRTRPRWRSEKRAALAPERAALVEEVMRRDGYRCQATALTHDCYGPLDVHEIISRAQWADGYLVAENCVTACRSGHDAIHARPEEAHALGLLRWSWERPY